ncbi:hypothetical protein B0H19DRAFT_1145877 [Mycena capillaripes]|nr:hypothetical protein B0H19DRAFT_1145877 [Mycena capillaripes]
MTLKVPPEPTMHPALPPELQCHIFELAALSRPVSIPKLMRVAKRVKHWVEPLLYRTLVFDSAIDEIPRCSLETLLLISRTKPASFLHAVRNVMGIYLGPEEIHTIIRLCPCIHNLFAYSELHSSTHPMPPEFYLLPLRQLFCYLTDIFRAPEAPTHPLFSRITHLDVFHWLTESDDQALARWARLGELPSLTHLALNDGTSLAVCVRLLAVCKFLCALLVLGDSLMPSSAEVELLADSPHFVIMEVRDYVADWQRGVLTGNDYWTRADAFIAKKISGEVDRRTFYLKAAE